jgi:hypothetical protein
LSPSSRAALTIIVLLFIIAGLIYSVSTPLLDVSDEVRHYALVEHLAQGNGLPVQNPQAHGFYEQEGSQPPLYYALMALLALPFDRSDFMALAQFNPHARLGRADATNNWNQLLHSDAEQFPWHGVTRVVHLIRVLGVLMGALTVVCTYTLARELTEGVAPPRYSTLIPLLAAAFTAFNPMFVFISASVNNDNLSAMLSALGLLAGVRIMRRGLTWQQALGLGMLLGGAALSKASALALLVMLPLGILLSAALRARSDTDSSTAPQPWSRLWPRLRTPVIQLAACVGLALLIAGWWYVRNAYYYGGDFTGTSMMATIAGAREVLPSAGELIGEWDGFIKSYWGLFGAVNIPMPLWIYAALNGLLMLAGVGLLLVASDGLRRLRQRSPTSLPAQLQALAALVCLGTFAVAFVALIRWTSITLASQGRLLFPVIAVISTFIAWGLWRLVSALGTWKPLATPRMQRLPAVVAMALPVLLAALTLLCPFLYIQPAYATPARLANEAALPNGVVSTELRFGEDMRWLGYHVETERVQPGEEFVVTLYWQALQPMRTNYSAGIRLFGRGDSEVLLLDTYPGGGMWQTTRWTPGQIIADRYRLRIPQTLTVTQLMPTVLRLDVGVWDFATKQFLQTYESSSGKPTGRQRYEVAGLAVSAGQANAADTSKQGGFSQAKPIEARSEQQGRRLTLHLTWAVTADYHEDYTIFAQLLDGNGKIVSQADGRAANNDFSARWWRMGDRVEDPHIFDLPADLPAGNYTIHYGLYRKDGDGARMPAFDAQGQPIPDAALKLAVTIQ